MNDLSWLKNIGSKLFSGRYFLTVCCGVVFVYCAVYKILEPAAISAIVVGVFKDYFDRTDRNGNGTSKT